MTDGRYEEQAAEEIAGSGALVRVEIGRTGAAQRGSARGAGRWLDHAGARGRPRELGRSASLRVDVVPRRPDGRHQRPRGGPACREGRGGGGPHRGRVRGGRRRPPRGRPAPGGATHRVAAFAGALDEEVRRGADGISFETIVASGPNGSRPHHEPGARVIEAGDLVVVDFGALVDGYHSDMTRTFAVGGLHALVPRAAADVGGGGRGPGGRGRRGGPRGARPGSSTRPAGP